MKLIALKKSPRRFSGFVDENGCYIFFIATRSKTKRLLSYDKNDFVDIHHFRGLISKFFPGQYFLKHTISIESISFEMINSLL
jgi:hypothetical protein